MKLHANSPGKSTLRLVCSIDEQRQPRQGLAHSIEDSPRHESCASTEFAVFFAGTTDASAVRYIVANYSWPQEPNFRILFWVVLGLVGNADNNCQGWGRGGPVSGCRRLSAHLIISVHPAARRQEILSATFASATNIVPRSLGKLSLLPGSI